MSDTEVPAAETADFRPEARAPRGFADKRARDILSERQIITRVSAVYEQFGFEPLQTPAFEYADALGKFLPDADRPNAGVFALQDDDDQWMALRYDHTAPLARFAAQNWETLPKPYRRYAFGPVWRNEKPGPGRYREFIQCDADTVGSDRPEADAELIALAVAGFAAAGLPDGATVLKVNNRKLLNGVLAKARVSTAGQQLAVLRAIDKLDKFGTEGVIQLLGAGRLDESGDYTKGAQLDSAGIDAVMAYVGTPVTTRSGFLEAMSAAVGDTPDGLAGLEELSRMDAALKALGVREDQARFDAAIVRGLEYYTGPVFEAELMLETRDERGQPIRFGSVGGGGRYDDLVSRFLGERIPATGFSFGVSRLAAALQAAGTLDLADQTRGPIVIIAFGDTDMPAYQALAAEVRAAGLACEVYMGRSGMKAQMKYADRRRSPAVLMLGEDEIKAGTVTLKDLDMGRQLAAGITDNAAWRAERPGQATLPRADLINHLVTLFGKN